MKKRIIICLLCLIMLVTNITPAMAFKAYAADEYVEDELVLEENDSYASSDYSGDSDDVIDFEEDSFANSSYTGTDSGVPQITETDAAAESGSSGEDAFENGKPVFYDVNTFHYSDNPEEPDDVTITEADYVASQEKDKNNNGILDILEEDEDDEVQAAAIQTGILGDLNGDEVVDNKDVILLYRHVAGWEQDINDDILDFNGDGYVNNSDGSYLLKYVSGWPDIVLYKGKKYDIIYHLTVEGAYLKEEDISNPNPDYYYSSEGLTLKNIQANGYIFEGWYDGEGESADRIRKINAGETGVIELYARWTPRLYEINFDSPLSGVPKDYYTIETGATLIYPMLSNYNFIGWTHQDNGQFMRNIPKGSFGNVTLVANWAARRNLTKPVQNLEDPIIIEHEDDGKIMFVYRLGEIDNVPLFTLCSFATAQGMATNYTFTEQTSITETNAQTILRAISNSTTDSAMWTLANGWNDSTMVSEETLRQTGKERDEAESIAKSSSDTYRLDTTVGESSVTVDSSQHTFKGTAGLASERGTVGETGKSYELSVDARIENSTTIGAEVSVPKIAKTNASNTTKVSVGAGAEFTNSVKNTESKTDTWERTFEAVGERAKTNTTSKNWNQLSSISNTNSVSNTKMVSQHLSELLSDKYEIGKTYIITGEQSSSQGITSQSTNENEYSNSITYNKSALHTEVREYHHDGTVDGYFRLVVAGKMHVFAVVGYDVATRSYFTDTFSIMDDNTKEFLDYSKYDPSFEDNEIGVLPFEIPTFVNEYVNARIAHSQGLVINIQTGNVTDYTGEDPIVVVPSYIDVNNGDGTFSSVKVTGFTADAFRGNTTIEGIMFGDFVTEIPDFAFEGCTSLCDIYIPNLTSIGKSAFSGCTSLSTLTIPDTVTSLGDGAFYNVNEVKITAANKDVALAAVNSGVKNLVLNISSINGEMADTVLEAPSAMQMFEVQGGRKQYNNLQIISGAGTTRINGINFDNNKEIPLKLSSPVIDLNQTSVSSSRYCMIITAENCDLSLFGTNQMNASRGDAIICGNVSLNNIDPSSQATATLQVSGNIYVCGNITNADRYLNHTNGRIIPITPDQFANLESFMKVLPATVSITGPKTVYEGQTISLTAAVDPDNAYDKTVTWSSSNKSVATVNSEGVVTGIKAGTTDISVTANGDPNVKSTVTITVQPPYVTGIAIVTYPATTGFIAGDTFSAAGLTIRATYNNGIVETHDVSDCTISSPNMTAAGTKQVTVSYGGKSATYNITVSALTISLSANTSTGTSGYIQLSASVPRGTVSWVSNNTGIATVDSSGKVTFKKSVGTAVITATVNNNGVTKSASKTITISNSQGTKFGETSTSSSATVLYGTQPGGYSTSLPVTGSIPSYTTNSADVTNSSTNTSTGRVDVTYANNGVDGYVYYQFNYNSSSGADNENKIINYQEGWRQTMGEGNDYNYYYYTSFGRQFYSGTNYPEHTASAGWTKYYARWWAYQDQQAGHTWYVASGISGALAASWYRFPLTRYTRTTTTYTYYYFTVT